MLPESSRLRNRVWYSSPPGIPALTENRSSFCWLMSGERKEISAPAGRVQSAESEQIARQSRLIIDFIVFNPVSLDVLPQEAGTSPFRDRPIRTPCAKSARRHRSSASLQRVRKPYPDPEGWPDRRRLRPRTEGQYEKALSTVRPQAWQTEILSMTSSLASSISQVRSADAI